MKSRALRGEANLQAVNENESYRIVKVNPKGIRGSRATTAPAKTMERAKILECSAEEPSGVKGSACRGTLSIAEAGKLRLNKAAADIADRAYQLRLAIEPLAEEKDISIQLEVLTQQTTLCVDANRIKQVLIILLTNAIKYSNSQGIISFRILNENNRRSTHKR
ncbi:MAG: hypothetical protein ACQEXQ_21780 [Bacillota bacterium]